MSDAPTSSKLSSSSTAPDKELIETEPVVGTSRGPGDPDESQIEEPPPGGGQQPGEDRE